MQWLPNFRLAQAAAGRTPAASPSASQLHVAHNATSHMLDSVGSLDDSSDKPSAMNRRPPISLMSLPLELHMQIAQQLIYPDALSLKQTSHYFNSFVDTGVVKKVDWLVSRRLLHLDCPNGTHCDLGSDLRFCRGSVPLLMKRRREHVECESRPDMGCLIYNTRTCVHRRPRGLMQRWFRRRLTVEMWWVLLALVPLVLSWMWFAELIASVV